MVEQESRGGGKTYWEMKLKECSVRCMWEVRKGRIQGESWVSACSALAAMGIQGRVLGSIWDEVHSNGPCKIGCGVRTS